MVRTVRQNEQATVVNFQVENMALRFWRAMLGRVAGISNE